MSGLAGCGDEVMGGGGKGSYLLPERPLSRNT